MKTLKSLIVILLVCGLCTKVAVRTYRHFHPPAEIVGP